MIERWEVITHLPLPVLKQSRALHDLGVAGGQHEDEACVVSMIEIALYCMRGIDSMQSLLNVDANKKRQKI